MIHRRRSIRLPGFDYTQPIAYYITICIQNRWEPLFGHVINSQMMLNDAGRIVHDEWLKTGDIRPNVTVDEFVVMPDHLHGILVIGEWGATFHRRVTLQRDPTPQWVDPISNMEQFGKPVSNSIPTMVRLFKSTVTKQINEYRNTPGAQVWQRNYYESVIRNVPALNRIRQYIRNNPGRARQNLQSRQIFPHFS